MVTTPRLAFRVDEAAEASRIPRTQIYGHMKSGRLPYRQIGRHRIILARDLEAFLEAGDGAKVA